MSNILLVGRLPGIVENMTKEIRMPNVSLYGATNAKEIRTQLEGQSIDLVIMGGGLDDDQRGELCKLIMSIRDDLCIHLKDRASGPGGMANFIKGVIKGFLT